MKRKNIDCVANLNKLSQEISKQKEPHRRKDGEITDVMDGLLYKKRFDDDDFLHGSNEDKTELHISLQINTDGVTHLHSSSFSLSPIYFMINELPPHLRLVKVFDVFYILSWSLNAFILNVVLLLSIRCHEN